MIDIYMTIKFAKIVLTKRLSRAIIKFKMGVLENTFRFFTKKLSDRRHLVILDLCSSVVIFTIN